MQPYFFPYIGYFQLIDAVDVYVNLDHVSFMKGSYMTRNTLKNNVGINIPCKGGSQNKTCNNVEVILDRKWFSNFNKTLEYLYKKENNFTEIMEVILIPWYDYLNQYFIYDNYPCTISNFNRIIIQQICEYLDIKTKLIDTSFGITGKKKNEGLQDIVKYYQGDQYINAIGGQSLYTKEDFASQGIDLKFIKMGDVKFDNPYSSILDLLFRYDKEYIKTELKKYELI